MRSYFTTLTILTSAVASLALGCGSSVTPSGTGAGGSSASATTSATTGAGSAASTGETTGAGGAMSSGTGAGGSGGSSGTGELGPFACSGVAVKFNADVAPVFNGCSGGDSCHAVATGFQSPASTYAYLVGKMSNGCNDGTLLVAPGDPEHSYVINKLSNHALCGGSAMPKGVGFKGVWKPKPEADVQKIYDWICTGAKND